jgi:hypothetical protein
MQLAAPRPVVPLEKLELDSDNTRQREYNEAIPQRLSDSDEEARERVEDAIQLAKWMRPNQPFTDVFVSPEPVIHLIGEEDGQSFEITLAHGHFGYSVNQNPHVTIKNVHDRIPVGRKLVTVWETLVAHLPEGFIIYGPDVDPQSEDFATREKVLLWLGFGATEENGDRFGIVREGKVTPLSGAEFAEMAGENGIANLFDQRFMVQEIIWSKPE